MTDATPQIDQQALQQMVQRMLGYVTGTAVSSGIALGDRLGLYQAMVARGSAMTSDELAAATDTQPRLVREWLDGQTAAGLLTYDEDQDRYGITPEATLVLGVEDSPAFIVGAAEFAGVAFRDMDRMEQAFRGDGAFGWKDHDPSLFPAMGRMLRPGYVNQLTSTWIPALEGVPERLADGGAVADIGCGTGHTSVLMAEAFPELTVTGVDYDPVSLDLARENAARAGVEDRVEFIQGDANGYDGRYDLIAFFNCLHDLGDPVATARHAGEHLTDGGTLLLAEPFALDGRSANFQSPVAPLLYHISTFQCVPNSLSQPGRHGLGCQAGEDKTRELLQEAGFSHFRRVAETPLTIVYEVRL